jgi:peptidoglycan/LPS O-acetylase OafA/YrhL
VLSALAYIANWRFYFAGRSYSELFSAPSPVLHFWSLAIEEQFYVLFPLVVALVLTLGRGRRAVLAGVLVAGTGASVAAGVVLSNENSRVYYGTDTRAAELLIGALLAVALHRRITDRTVERHAGLPTTLAGISALATLLALWTTVDQSDAWLARGGFALHACLTAIVIAAVSKPGPLASTLSWKPLVALGAISYGVYLFHWPLFLWLTPERTGLSGVPLFALRVGLAVVVASMSFRYLERPIRTGVRLRGTWPRVLAPAVIVAIVAGCAAVTSAAPKPSVVLKALGDSHAAAQLATVRSKVAAAKPPATTPTLAKPSGPQPVVMHRPLESARPLRIMVVGDSVGISFGRGVELWALEHNARVSNVARKWCSLGRDLPRMLYGAVQNAGPCSDWDTSWPGMLDDFDPDVVLVMFTAWEAVGRQLPGRSDFLSPGAPELDAWQLSEYEAATDLLSSRGAHVVWFTVPCDDHVIEPPLPLWYVNRRTLPRLVAARPGIHVIDLDHELCAGGRAKTPTVYAGVADARPDARHFSDPGAYALANWVMPIVEGAAAPPPLPSERTAKTIGSERR